MVNSIAWPYSRAWATLARSRSNSAMSAPAAKALVPAPRSTTQRRASSAESSAITAPRRSQIARLSAFSRSGLFSATVAILPSRVTITVSCMAMLPRLRQR